MDSVSAGAFRSRQGISLQLSSVSFARLGGNAAAVGEICHFALLNSFGYLMAHLGFQQFLPTFDFYFLHLPRAPPELGSLKHLSYPEATSKILLYRWTCLSEQGLSSNQPCEIEAQSTLRSRSVSSAVACVLADAL